MIIFDYRVIEMARKLKNIEEENMKRTLKTLLSVMLAVLLCLALVSCAAQDTQGTQDAQGTTQGTQDAQGTTQGTQDTQGTTQETQDTQSTTQGTEEPKHEHVGEWTTVKEPTCTDIGEQTLTCKDCGETQKKDIPAKGHAYGAEATCTEASICTVCNAELAPKGHTPGEISCTEAQTCTVCNEVLAEAPGHTPGEATCTEPQTCTVCNTELAEALGHAPGRRSCTEGRFCVICSEVLEEPTGHTPDGEPSCGWDQTCRNCDEVLTPALPHTPGAEATCAAAQTCTVCSHVITPALPHTEVIDPAVPPTPEKNGLTQGSHCSVCGTVIIPQRESIFVFVTPAGAPTKYSVARDDEGIHYTNLLDFNKGTNELWAHVDEFGNWECFIDYDDTFGQPADPDTWFPIAPVIRPLASFSAHRWSFTEDGEALHFESTDNSPYPGIAFSIDLARDGLMPIGRESGKKAEYVKIRVRNLSSCDQMTFGFITNNTNNGNFVSATISELTEDMDGKTYESSGEWVTYTFSMYELNMNTNYDELIYDPLTQTPSSRWGSNLLELVIFPFGYDVTDGTGNYAGAAMDIDYIVVGSEEYVRSYQSALEVKESNVQSLELLRAPDKKTYYVGEALDLSGLELKATYADGTVEMLNSAGASVSTFVEEEDSVTLKYGNYSVSFPVTVIGITSIEMAEIPEDKIFEVADLEYGFNSEGYRIQVNYADGTHKISDEYSTELSNSRFEFAVDFSAQTVDVYYLGKSTTFEIIIDTPVDLEITADGIFHCYRYSYYETPAPRYGFFSINLIYSDGSKISADRADLDFTYEIVCPFEESGVTKATVTATNEKYGLTFVKEVDVELEVLLPIGLELDEVIFTEFRVGQMPISMIRVGLIYEDGNLERVYSPHFYLQANTSTAGEKKALIVSDDPYLQQLAKDADLHCFITVYEE